MRWGQAVARAAIMLVALLAACPRLPPPAPRPRARLLGVDRAGSFLAARLAVEGAGSLQPVAVDWALAVGDSDLVRGRAAGLDLRMPLPAAIGTGALVRLRGAVHLEGDGGQSALAPFDEVARVP